MDNESLDRRRRMLIRYGVGVGILIGAAGTCIAGPTAAVGGAVVTIAYAYIFKR